MNEEEMRLAQEAEDLLKATYHCEQYDCTILPGACAKRYAAAQAGADKVSEDIDFELCLLCERGLLAFKESGLEIPKQTGQEARQAQRHRWVGKNGGQPVYKKKPCDKCHESFQPNGGRQTTCHKCKPPKEKKEKQRPPSPPPVPALPGLEPQAEIVNKVPALCEGVIQKMTADLNVKLIEARDLYTALKVLKQYDDSIKLPDLKQLGG